MCFTININTSRDAIETRFNVKASVLRDFEFRYFYRAFTNPFLPVITQENRENVQLFQWGLIPHWTKDIEQAHKIRKGTYNARSESLKEKPSFKNSIESKRCLIIARGFFEWQHYDNQKIPWYIHAKKEKIIAFAGLYDSWDNPETGQSLNTFSIVTTAANEVMEKIHNTKKRMPLILFEKKENKWLDPSMDSEKLVEIFMPYGSSRLKCYTIGKNISYSTTNPNDPSVLSPVEYPIDKKLF